MGTSQSKPSAKPGSPLITPWADQDPLPPGTPQSPPPANQNTLKPRRTVGFRRSLKNFYRSGDQADARRALGRYVRGSVGSGSVNGKQIGRAARLSGNAFAALTSAAAGQAPAAGLLDLRNLAGRPLSEAISSIVDAFCPPGILDEDTIRAAMAEALAEAFTNLDQFDLEAITDHTIIVATRCFVAELVFTAVIAEQGQSAAVVTPLQAVKRENELRDVIREIADVVATPILQQVAHVMTPRQIAMLVQRILVMVNEEISKW